MIATNMTRVMQINWKQRTKVSKNAEQNGLTENDSEHKTSHRKNIYVIDEYRDSFINDTINNGSEDTLRISHHTYEDYDTAEIKGANKHISGNRKPHMDNSGQGLQRI